MSWGYSLHLLHACCLVWRSGKTNAGMGSPCRLHSAPGVAGQEPALGFDRRLRSVRGSGFQAALEDAREQAAAAQREAADGESRALELESNLAKHKAVYVVCKGSSPCCMHGRELFWMHAAWPTETAQWFQD